MSKYALFLGCTVPVRGLNYELSARKVADRLGIEIVDITDFACCGFPIAGVHHETGLTLAARNLALAEAQGLDIMTLCSACTGHLTKAQKHLSSPRGTEEQKKINDYLGGSNLEYKGNTKVKHFARVLYEDVGLDKVKEAVTNPLTSLTIAPHYGCHYIKPSTIFDGFDDPINPVSLDKLIEVTGATSVRYKNRLQCCGGGILSISEDTSVKMVKEKLDNIKTAEADAMTLLCPFCSIMYDEYQPTIETSFDAEYNIPVLFYSQLLGIAMGLDPKKDLAVKINQVKVSPLLEKVQANGGA